MRINRNDVLKLKQNAVSLNEHVTNIAIVRRTNLPHIGSLIAARRYLWSHRPSICVCSQQHGPQDVQRHVHKPWYTLNMEAPRGRLRSSWTAQLKSDTGVPLGTSWKRAWDGRWAQRLSGATRFSERVCLLIYGSVNLYTAFFIYPQV